MGPFNKLFGSKESKRAEELARLLQEKYPGGTGNFARMYAEELGRMGEPALGPIARLLKNKDGHVRERAAHALGEMKSERAAEFLFTLLRDKDFMVREKAAESLALIGEPAVVYIAKALKEKDPQIQETMLAALYRPGISEVLYHPLIKGIIDLSSPRKE